MPARAIVLDQACDLAVASGRLSLRSRQRRGGDTRLGPQLEAGEERRPVGWHRGGVALIALELRLDVGGVGALDEIGDRRHAVFRCAVVEDSARGAELAATPDISTTDRAPQRPGRRAGA